MVTKLLSSFLLIFCIDQVKSNGSQPIDLSKLNSYIDIVTDPETTLRFYSHPCSDVDEQNETKLFQPVDLPRHTQNPYLVFIKNGDFIPENTEIVVTLASPVTVYFYEYKAAHVTSTSNYTFTIRANNDTNTVVFLIERTKPSVVPLIASISINNVEFCKEPNASVIWVDRHFSEGPNDRFIERYKNFLQISLPVPDDFCGTRKVVHTKLIVNGFPTKPGDWPWHAALYKIYQATSSYICGGTLISKFFVLTAAHCVTHNGSPVLPDVLSVVLGKYNLRGWDNTAVEKEVHEVTVSDMFNPNLLNNDIALLKLATEVEYSDYIQPACLWRTGLSYKLPETPVGTVVGWGVDHTEKLSKQLQQVQIPMVKDVVCLKSNRAFFGRVLDENNFCAGYRNGTSACNGDSGGGFTILIEGRYHVRGVVSAAVSKQDEPVCDPNHYVLFTDVDKYLTWIRANIK